MAITVRDIQEKEFSKQKLNGYSVEEVDDFLDELAEQLGVLIRENIALKEEAKKLAEKAEQAAAPAPAPAESGSAYDEPQYFKNLEQAMRETLISSQRIADDTVAEARKKAQELLNTAQEQADVIAATAKAELDAAKAESEALHRDVASYREETLKSLDQQQAAIDQIRAVLG